MIKPVKNNPTVYPVFASVSPVLRDGITNFRNKVVIGLSSCKIYDGQQTKRCNNCQHYGHFAKHCPMPETPSCGKCSGDHRTDSCNSEERKCINCVRKNETDNMHAAFAHKCPTLQNNEQILQNKSLNYTRNRRDPVT